MREVCRRLQIFHSFFFTPPSVESFVVGFFSLCFSSFRKHPSSFLHPLWFDRGIFAKMWDNRVHSARALWFLACLEEENGSQDSQPQGVT
jgi:hypothetical protein